MSLNLPVAVLKRNIEANLQNEPNQILEMDASESGSKKEDKPNYPPPELPAEETTQEEDREADTSQDSTETSSSGQEGVEPTVEEPEEPEQPEQPGDLDEPEKSEEAYEVDEAIDFGSEQHLSAVSVDLLPKEEQESKEESTSPGEKTDVSSDPYSVSHSVSACVPSMETLVVEVPSLVAGYDIGVCNLPTQRERMVARDGIKLNFMVAGQTGLGKTTFVNTLFDTCVLPSAWETNNKASRETKSLEIHRAFFETDDIKFDLEIIDTPGFGYKSKSTFDWVPLIDYIDEQMRSYIFQEEQPNRSNLTDSRVHCCLYFLEPTGKGLKSLDVIAMREISKRVNMIPIIAKADGLTEEEIHSFKQEIRSIMLAQGIKVCQFLEEGNRFYSNIFERAPFAIIGSDMKIIGQYGQPVHVRKYRWGTVEVENVDHCDFNYLKEVLVSNHLVDFVRTTESYYESCRSSILKTRILKAKEHIDDTAFPAELRDELQKLNYQQMDLNGFKNFLCYSVFGKKDMDLLVAEWSPEFVQRRWESRKKFNEVVTLEDKKFQEWKKALQNKQMKFNQELESLHQSIDDLQLECHDLETQIVAAKAVHRTRSKLGTISRGEKRAAA